MPASNEPVAIVSGAGRGIGRATAIDLAGRGWRVAILSRTRSELEETARSCGGRAIVHQVDVREEAQVGRVVAGVVADLGRIDAVVNNAGTAPFAEIEQTGEDVWRLAIESNLTAAMILTRLCWPHLKRQGGVIVNVSSMSAIDPFPGLAAYAAAKGGMNGLTAAFANEGSPLGIRCIGIAPAATETQMFRSLPGAQSVPGESVLAPEEVGRVIADCITGPLRYATGQTIYLRKTK